MNDRERDREMAKRRATGFLEGLSAMLQPPPSAKSKPVLPADDEPELGPQTKLARKWIQEHSCDKS